MISVTVSSPDLDIAEQWDSLSQKAANVFMNPVALKAASETMLAVISVLLAWDIGMEPSKLVGIWAVQAKNILPWWPAFAEALPYEYAFLSTPMVHPDYADEVMPAFFAAMAKHPKLPKVVWMQDLDAGGPVFAAMQKSIGQGGLEQLEIKTGMMPVVTREFGIKSSGSTRKKLRQDWNRLSALGRVEVANVRNQASAIAAMEVFLRLERASWKGERGTALLCSQRDAAFARRLVRDLSARGDASVALLTLDGKPVAAQVLLYCGRVAYTWKIAFDAEFARFSPGALLVDKITEQLLAGDIEMIDSCAAEGSFMGQIWAGRKPVASLLVNVAPGLSPAFVLESAHRRVHEMLRQLRDHIREAQSRGKRKPVPSPVDKRDSA